MTLTEFLLARIAEDEDQARAAIAKRDAIPFIHPPTVPDMDLVAFEDVGVPAVLVGPERVLADCEAKRRIVEQHRKPTVAFGGVECWRWELMVLAEVYADHPDYRDEWKAA